MTILFLKYSNVFKYLIGYKIRRKHYLCVIKQAVNNEPRYYLCHSYRPGRGYWMYRVSGPEAIEITSCIFTPAATNRELGDSKPYTLTFGRIYDGSEVIDEVLVSLFRAPHSYTGENSTEITCHGSAIFFRKYYNYSSRMVVAWLPRANIQRAFLNGKMDLSQAEAVADLIASSSAATHRLAMSQMRGGFSKELATLRDQLLHFTSLIELELDFSDHEELEFADRSELCQLANNIEKVIARLVNSFNVGNAIKNGVPVAIIGETNAGKSTLLNVLLNEDKAIVSDIHGTTRDIIEDTVNIGGITFRFIDTAGIRETSDTIESLGIERTFQKLDQAEIVLWMIDATNAQAQITQLAGQLLPRCERKQLILVYNKADLVDNIQNSIPDNFPDNVQSITLSAKKREHIEELQRMLITSAIFLQLRKMML